jgi:hypothetical protein
VVIRSRCPSGRGLAGRKPRVDVCCVVAARGPGVHATVNPVVSNKGVLLSLLTLVLALACVVVLGRVLSVCCWTCIAWCCHGRGDPPPMPLSPLAPPLSAAHSVYFGAIGVKSFFRAVEERERSRYA